MTTAVYIRVSTEEQTLESQRSEIRQWLERNPQSGVRWYEDQVTGKTLNRPGFRKLQTAIRQGKMDTVIVWKLDRLSRSFLNGVEIIGDWTKRGIRIISTTQNIDMSGITGQMIASVLFAVAEMELQHNKERQAAGIAVAKTQGKYKGRKPGSRKGNPQRARELKQKGNSEKEIAAALNVSERTVFRYLQAG